MSTLERAIEIAVSGHKGQKDKANVTYILHPLRVMFRMDTEPEMIAAVLHDIVEDTNWTLEGLWTEGFSDHIVNVIDYLTRREGETYNEFIGRLKNNKIARKVKLADLEDNMNIRRLSSITTKEIERIRKYHRAWLILSEEKNDQQGIK